MTVWTTVGDWLLWLGAIPAVGTVITYARVKGPTGQRGAWSQSAWGRLLMTHMTSVAIVLVLGCVRLAFGDAWWFAGLRVLAFAVVVGALWVWWVFLLTTRANEKSEAE